MSTTNKDSRPTIRLDTTFLTGADGKIYEIPLAEAGKYVVTPARVAELGHLPITPYTSLVPKTQQESSDADGEVGGRHKVWLNNGHFGYHNDWLYGTYRWVSDGYYYTGMHRHPYGMYDPDAIDADNL